MFQKKCFFSEDYQYFITIQRNTKAVFSAFLVFFIYINPHFSQNFIALVCIVPYLNSFQFFFSFFYFDSIISYIDISINISSPPCTKGDLFWLSSLTVDVMIASYRKAYQLYCDNLHGTYPTLEGASFPGNSVFPATANQSKSLSNSR